MEDTEQTFSETVLENFNLAKAYNSVSETPQLFLRRDDRIFGRCLTVDEVEREVWLRYSFDIDGCVVEFKSLAAIRMPVRHITLFPNDNASLRNVRGFLKKHVRLTEYSKSELMTFSNSLGFQLFYERGWECWIALIPMHQMHSVALSIQQVRQQALATFLQLRENFKNTLMALALRGEARRTLEKNDINDVRKMFILPDDCYAILDALQASLNQLTQTGLLRPIIFCFRFGEKMTRGLSLSDFNTQFTLRTTIHVAANILSDSEEVDLLWSTAGLQQIIGHRGTLCTCLSFKDCANYQSNLDGRPMDIKTCLRTICRFPHEVQFVQLYADIPHRQPNCRYHPVSGCIVGGMCFPRSTAEAFLRDADHYISTLQSNWTLLRRSTCRIEFVVSQDSVADHINAMDFINLTNLEVLLETVPLLVPFPLHILTCIRHLGLWICKELKELLNEYKKTGNVRATWQSYQLELASEKLLWGKPLCGRSTSYSINLGPGALGPSRSSTDHYGFLSLEVYSTCMQNEYSIPPQEIWTTSEVISKMIKRSVGLHDHLDGSYGVIGRHLVVALLHDLHETGKAASYVLFEDFLREIKSCKTTFKTVGAVTIRSLVKLLTTNRRTNSQMVFPSLYLLLDKSNISVAEVIKAGILELDLKHFPAVTTYDRHGNMTLTWSFNDKFWTVVYDKRSTDITENTLVTISDLVRGELEKRGLIYPSKIKKTPKILPWLTMCLRRLQKENMDMEQLVITMTYISCIALLMQGQYVEYDRLALLTIDLPVDKNKLIALEILSKLQLASFRFRNLQLNRLHFTIPHKLEMLTGAEKKSTKKGETKQSEEVTTNDNKVEELPPKYVDHDNADDDPILFDKDIGHRRTSTCFPISTSLKAPWSAQELEFLHAQRLAEVTIREKYERFKLQCLRSNIPFRTFRAFETKLQRLSNK